MKKKNGFISTSVIYSFFLVFLMLILLMVSNLISNRLMLNSIKDTVFEDISNTNFARYLVSHSDSLGLSVIDNEYRYVGSSVDNFVCFSSSCTNNQLYRVIGVIDGKVKLIKYTSIGDMAYNSTSANNVFYETSIYTYLNNTYLNTLITYSDYINSSVWYIGGLESSYITGSSNDVFEYELGLYRQNQTINAKIGLPYISDYLYAASDGNWMLNGDMWFITKVITDTNNTVFYVDDSGNIENDLVSSLHAVYPVFYLNSNIGYLSGSGSLTDPFIVG